MELTIRKGTHADFDEVQRIYATARRFMCDHGNPTQWGTTSPPRVLTEFDIKNGTLYIVEGDGAIRGAFALITDGDPLYCDITEGQWHYDRPYGVIHRIASDGTAKGVAQAAFAYCEAITPYLRIDTHADNLPMQRAVMKYGFRRCGIVPAPNGTPRIAYDFLRTPTEDQHLGSIVSPLLRWYGQNKRSMPWRDDPTPYHVWLSEIMLQQTRVEAVRPYYANFLKACPDIETLANADDEMLKKLWEGLGYYSRVRNLKKCAVQICTEYGGKMPDDTSLLRKLAGIGPYTAGAIASIAFGKRTPAVDGNVLRVITRLTGDGRNIDDERTKTDISERLARVYPESADDVSAMTQGLMELGALVCVPNGAPLCDRCPLRDQCTAFLTNSVDRYPEKSPKKPRKIIDRNVYLIIRSNRVAIVKRPEKGLLAGMWEYPSFDSVFDKFHNKYTDRIRFISNSNHIFTHLEWHMKGFLIELGEDEMPPDGMIFVTAEELKNEYAIPGAYHIYTEYLLKNLK